MFERGSFARAPHVFGAVIVACLLCSTALVVTAAGPTFESVIRSITALSNLKVLEQAIAILDAGGPEAEAIKEDPRHFLQEAGLATGEEMLVLLIHKDDNEALTPIGGTLAASPEGYRLSNVVFVFSGARRGVIVQQKIPSDAPLQAFEQAATESTLWIEHSLDYIARVVHWVDGLDAAEDAGLLEFFFLAPVDFYVEQAVAERVLGEAITFPFLETAFMTAIDTGRIEDPDAGQFVPAGPLGSEEAVVIGIGDASSEWLLCVQLTEYVDF